MHMKILISGGAQVAQMVEQLTLGVSSSHNLGVMGLSPEASSALSSGGEGWGWLGG